MKAEELNKLMEAYNSMYAPKEEVVESEQLDENPILDKLRSGLKKIGVSGTSPTLDKERRAQTETERKGRYANTKAKGDGSYASGALNNSADLFDIVKGHLMSEGLTEEEALQKMITMTEEERQSILSEDPVQDYRDRRRAEENRAGLRGPELSHASDKTTQPAGGPSKKTPTPTSPKTPTPTSPKTPTPTSPKTPNAGTNKPNSSVSSPGFDTRRIGGYDLRRLP